MLTFQNSLKELFSSRFKILWISSFLIGVLDAPMQALLAVYVEAEIEGTPLLSAGLRSTFLLLGGLFAIPAGTLCDKIGTKTTFILGSTGTLVAGFVFLVHRPDLLFLLCLYIGVATGFSTTAGQTYLIHAAPRSSLGLGSAAFFMGMTLGSATGSRLAGMVVDTWGFETMGGAMVILTSLVLLGTALLMPEIREDVNPSKEKGSAWGEYLVLLKRRDVRLLVSVRFLPTCYWGAATLLIPLLIFRATGQVSAAANYLAVSLVIATGCQLLVGRLADTFGPRVPTLTASTCVALSAIGTGLCAESVTGLYFFGITGTAAAWSVSTMMPRIIDLITSPGERGRVVGMAHLGWSLAMLTGSLWGGRAVEWHPGLPFYAVSIGCVLTVIFLYVLFKRIAGRELAV